MDSYFPESIEEFQFVQLKYSLPFTHIGILEVRSNGFLHSDLSLGPGIPSVTTETLDGSPKFSLGPDECLLHDGAESKIAKESDCSVVQYQAVCKEKLGT